MTVALLHLKKAMRFVTTRGPKYATFFVNTRCNRRCAYCVVTNRQNSEIATETWNIIADRAINWGVCLISIVGGEPTLRKDLADIIGHASKKVLVNLTSNGDFFAENDGLKYLYSLTSAGLSSVTLSLHELNDLERQIRILLSAKKSGAVPVLATVATKTSIELLPEVMQTVTKHGVFFRYSLCQTVGGDFSPINMELQPTREQISTFTDIVWREKQRTGLIMNTYEYLKKANLYPNNWHCNNHKDYWLHVNSDGTLMACSERPTSIKAIDIPSLDDPRWIEDRTKIRNNCNGCSNHCYIEQEKANGFSSVFEGLRYATALLRANL